MDKRITEKSLRIIEKARDTLKNDMRTLYRNGTIDRKEFEDGLRRLRYSDTFIKMVV